MSSVNLGRYRYGNTMIAEDAFGQLFRGVDRVSEQPVYIKVLSGRRDESDMDRRIHSWRTVKHPNLFLPRDTVSERGTTFTILQDPGGELLDHALPDLLSKGIQGRHHLLSTLVDVCKAVEALHAVGIVHGQINPATVVLQSGPQPEGCLLLADWFAPKSAGDYVAFTRYLPYVAQEQLRGAGSFQADIYAMAMLVHTSLAQPEPQDGGSGYERAERTVWGEPPPFVANVDGLGSKFVEALGLELDTLFAVVAKGIQRNPEARYLTAGDLRQALEELSRRMSPLAVGQRLRREKRFVEATAVFEEASSGPQALPAYVLIGRTLGLDLGNYEAGIVNLRRALKLDPNLDSARLALAEIYLRQKRYFMAKREYEEMLTSRPDDFALLEGYAAVLFASGNADAALNVLWKIREQNPYHLAAQISAIRIALEQKMIQVAERDSGVAVANVAAVVKRGNLNPREVADVYYLRAVALNRMGHGENAIRWAGKALDFVPLHVQSHRLLATLYRESGQMDEAIEHFVTFLSVSPDHEGIVAALGKFLSQEPGKDDARALAGGELWKE